LELKKTEDSVLGSVLVRSGPVLVLLDMTIDGMIDGRLVGDTSEVAGVE
jgi:hypothetical protein